MALGAAWTKMFGSRSPTKELMEVDPTEYGEAVKIVKQNTGIDMDEIFNPLWTMSNKLERKERFDNVLEYEKQFQKFERDLSDVLYFSKDRPPRALYKLEDLFKELRHQFRFQVFNPKYFMDAMNKVAQRVETDGVDFNKILTTLRINDVRLANYMRSKYHRKEIAQQCKNALDDTYKKVDPGLILAASKEGEGTDFDLNIFNNKVDTYMKVIQKGSVDQTKMKKYIRGLNEHFEKINGETHPLLKYVANRSLHQLQKLYDDYKDDLQDD